MPSARPRGRQANPAQQLLQRIEKRSAHLAVIGLGYVGLPLAVEFAEAGFRVTGIDIDARRVRELMRGRSYIQDVATSQVRRLVRAGKLRATTDYAALRSCDSVNICVPTPLSKQRDPDVSYIVSAAREVARYAHRGMLVILESTTYPGTTEEVLLPLLTEGGLKIGQTLYLAFSPERVDPGNRAFKTHNTFKLVGGTTPACLAAATTFYQQSIVKIFPLSSPRVAEMTKVFENVFRSVNIALVNELAILCDRMDVNVYEVIDAAATKNFGFMAFYPGPGVGGHCIPLDPYYLAWKSKEYDFHTRFIELAGEINEGMPYYVVAKLQRLLNRKRRCLRGATIFVLGVTYKADAADPRESPASKVMELLQGEGAELSYADPYTPAVEVGGQTYEAVEPTAMALAQCDCALILTGHAAFDYELIVRHAPLVFDTRNATRGVSEAQKVVLL